MSQCECVASTCGRRILQFLVQSLPNGATAAGSEDMGINRTSRHRRLAQDEVNRVSDRNPHEAVQVDLFDSSTGTQESIGFRSPVACSVAGITYRQLDYWARTGLVEPSVRDVNGSGNQRLYGFRDILMLKVVKRLLDAGVSLQNIRAAVNYLRSRSTSDLTDITLMSDGVSIYECTSDDELVDLVRQGQGVFGISVGSVWAEISTSLSVMPSQEALDGGLPIVEGTDELSVQRIRRIS